MATDGGPVGLRVRLIDTAQVYGFPDSVPNTPRSGTGKTKMEKQLAAGKRVMYTSKVNHSHATRYTDSIKLFAYTKDGPLCSKIGVQDSTDGQTAC